MSATSATVPGRRPPPPRFLRRAARALVTAVVVLFLGVFLVVPGPLIRPAADLGAEVAFGTINGREAIILAYDDHGFSGAGMFFDLRATSRVAAIDLATGETVWDRGLPDRPNDPDVIAAGRNYAYVRHGRGLVIVSVADGDIVAEPDSIDGLGDAYADDPRSYKYDPSRNAIMTITKSGALKEIPVDHAVAVDAAPTARDTWSCVLGDGRFAHRTRDYQQTAESVPTGQGTTFTLGRPHGAPVGIPTRRLHESDASGGREVSAADLFEPAFVLEVESGAPRPGACPGAQRADEVYPDEREAPAKPAGLATGHVVIQGTADANSADQVVTVFDVASGRVTASARADAGLDRAVTAPSGRLVLLARTYPRNVGWLASTTGVLLIVEGSGTLREAAVGKVGWFGL